MHAQVICMSEKRRTLKGLHYEIKKDKTIMILKVVLSFSKRNFEIGYVVRLKVPSLPDFSQIFFYTAAT